MATAEVIVAPRGGDVVASDFLPVLTVQQSLDRKEQMNLFISKVMRVDEDYGIIPGSKKPTLYKAGAEKLCSLFGLTPQYTVDSIVEDWTGENHGGEPMFYYAYRCSLSRGGRFMGEAIGSCSSWESKYRHRWVREDQLPVGTDLTGLPSKGGKQTLFAYDFAIEKAETPEQSAYGKPAEYWEMFRKAIADGSAKNVSKPFKSGKPGKGYEISVDTALYRVPNPDVADVVNTIQKMAQKRALVDAVKIVTNASDAFTQDLEDFVETGGTSAQQRGDGDNHNISSGGELFDDDEEKPPTPPTAAHPLPMYRWQRANPLEGVEIPDELSILFGAIDRDKDRKTAVTNGLQVMGGCFAELNDTALMKQHDEIRGKFRANFPRGATNAQIKGMLLDLFEILQRAKASKERGNGGI